MNISVAGTGIHDENIEKYLAEKKLDLTAIIDGNNAYKNVDFVVISAEKY